MGKGWEVTHNAASARGQSHTPGLSFLSVGAMPTKTLGNRYALSSQSKPGTKGAPGAQEAARRDRTGETCSPSFTWACLPPPQSTGHQKGALPIPEAHLWLGDRY